MPFSIAQRFLRALRDISRSPAARTWSELVERAPDTSPALVQDVGINHGRTHIAMPEQFLDRSDVVPGLEQMGREAVPQRILTLPMNQAHPPPPFTTVTIRSAASP